MAYTHNDIVIGNRVATNNHNGDFVVTDILDGYRGIGISRGANIHSKERLFVDIEDIRSVRK